MSTANPLVGSTVRFQITVTDPDSGDLIAATVSAVITDPSGNETAASVTNPSTGIYETYVDLDESGDFYVTWTVEAGNYTTIKECSACALATVLA